MAKSTYAGYKRLSEKKLESQFVWCSVHFAKVDILEEYYV